MAKRNVVTQGPAADVIDVRLAAIDEDKQIVVDTGRAVMEFLKNVALFFTRAREIERDAKVTLVRAQALAAPTTMEADEDLQRFILDTTKQKKAAEAHWSITAKVNQFHRRLTAARARATDPLEQANTIGNQLHNSYTEAERRRAAEEQERQRRAAEEQAQRDRDAELARAEAEAVRLEEQSAELSTRELLFVSYYFDGVTRGDGQRSAKLAGFKEPLTAAARLLSLRKIQQAIEGKRQAAALRAQSAAVAAQPLEVRGGFEMVRANISRVSGGGERTTHGAKVLDAAKLIEAVFAGGYGIPRDVLVVDESKVNQYGKDMKELINRWPGVAYTKNTKVV